jgi:glycosyltransferase involved in cell wall biosynthesis
MNRDKKTLIILTPGFPKDEMDTVCLPFLQNFVLELNERYPLLVVVVLAFDYPFTRTSYEWNKNEVIPFNKWRSKNISKLLAWFAIWKKMRKIRRSHAVIGLLSLWSGECAYLGNRFAKRNKLAHFCWIQGQDAKKENKFVKRIHPSPSELVAISDFIQDEFSRNHAIRPEHVIPVGIRPAEYSKAVQVRDIDVLGVGSLIPLKQYQLFVEVIGRIRMDFPDIRGELCGKGPEERELRAMIATYGLEKNILLSGELSHEEILQRMGRSRVFLHTSHFEGISVVCNEALYAGCQVISFVRLMHHEIAHWHIVSTKEEMEKRAVEILGNPTTSYHSVLTFTAGESVDKIMQLYGYNERTSS